MVERESAAEPTVELRAPAGKHRVVITYPKTGAQSLFGDFDFFSTAHMEADDKAEGAMAIARVFDDTGRKVADFGKRWST